MVRSLLGMLFLIISLSCPIFADSSLLLRDQLQHAVPGDYLVFSIQKTYTLLRVAAKERAHLTLEEVAIPEVKIPSKQMNWRHWLSQGAAGHTSWVIFDLDLATGRISQYYSLAKQQWFEITDTDNLLFKVLNLPLTKVPEGARKRIGPAPTSGPDLRPLWQPRLIVDGSPIENVSFDAWRARWPRDGSELAGKIIEIYLPRDHTRYPAYLPYWLQVSGTVGKAKIRIVDSGRGLRSPSDTKGRPSVTTPQLAPH